MSDLATCSSPSEYVQPSIIAQLKGRKEDTEKRLDEINRAIQILEKQPELSDLLTIVRRNC